MSAARSVAVLGAGIMGASAALMLARRGCAVALFDAADRPFSGASRWNEGKIHLGFMYAHDRSLETVRRLLPGGLSFLDDVEALVGRSLRDLVTEADEIYLVHKGSVASAERVESHCRSVLALAADRPGASRYLAGAGPIERLARAELAGLADTADITAGLRLPERSVQTQAVADLYVAALNSEPKITQHLSTRVSAVSPREPGAWDGPWWIETDRGRHGPFDAVVNALWEGRPALDKSLGLLPQAEWSHRYRLALFLRTRQAIDIRNTVIVVGPYGDIKNYGGGNFYVSWYPVGLLAEGHALEPPDVPALDEAARRRLTESILAELGRLLPPVKAIADDIASVRLEGGWVFAEGTGSLSDPNASLHQRHRVGIHGHGSYFSVNTGKFSIAPWLSRRLVGTMLGD